MDLRSALPAVKPEVSPSVSARRQDLGGDTAIYDPVLLTHVRLPSHTCPAVRVRPLSDAFSSTSIALFPLSREELGEVWVSEKDRSLWSVTTLPGSWRDAARVFRAHLDYPQEYLQALLVALRTHKFMDDSPLLADRWREACRQPIDLLYITVACSSCSQPRDFALRTVFSAPHVLPSWTCVALGFTCNNPEPEMIYTIPASQWTLAAAAVPSSSSALVPPDSPLSSPSHNLPQHSLVDASPEARHKPAPMELLDLPPPSPKPSPQPLLPLEDQQPVVIPLSPVADLLTSASSSSSSAVPKKTWTDLNRSLHPADRFLPALENDMDPFGMVLPRPSHYIVGEELTRFRSPDPTTEQIAEFQALEDKGKWGEVLRAFTKWAAGKRETQFEGKEEVASVVNWDNSMQFYFVTAPVRNPVIQAHLAVTTFRLRAQKWWRAQVQARPELVITYDQLREWIKTELVPKADPRSTSAAWRQLRFTGNVQEYIDQLEALKEHFPLMKDPLLDLSTAPLGEEARAVIYRADAMYGASGITHNKLCTLIKDYLNSLTQAQRTQLAEHPPLGQGYGITAAKPKPKVYCSITRDVDVFRTCARTPTRTGEV